MEEKPFFIFCEKCGKRLIERLPNGLWRFFFGRRKRSGLPVVNMLIHGSLKITCLRNDCGYENTLNYLPNQSPLGEVLNPPKVEESPKTETKTNN